eukprot:RCo019861
MNQLVERVLPVGPGLPEDDLPGLEGQRGAIQGHPLPVGLHTNLLDVRRELRHPLAVREDGVSGQVQEAGVPHRKQAHQGGQVGAHLGGAEVGVDVAAPGKEGLHHVEAVLQAQGNHAHSAGDAEPAPDPVPEPKRVVRVDAEVRHELQGGAACHHVLRHGVLPQLRNEPLLHRLRIEHRLRCGERLRHHNSQSALGVEAVERPGDVLGVHIGQEVQAPPRGKLLGRRVGLQGGVHKERSQEAPPDANRQNIPQGLPRGADPLPRADLVGEGLDLAQHGVHLGNHVYPVNHELFRRRGAQRDVQHGAVLRLVDVHPGEHLVNLFLQLGLLCELQQQLHRLRGRTLPRVVKVNPIVLRGHRRAAGLVRHQLPQVGHRRLGVLQQCLVCGSLPRVSHFAKVQRKLTENRKWARSGPGSQAPPKRNEKMIT